VKILRTSGFALALGIASLALFSSAPAQAASPCGHARVRTAIGKLKLYFRVRGDVGCDEAKRVVRSYFSRTPSQCIGSGCFIHLPSGWDCHAAPGEVTRREGTVADCSSDHGARRILTSKCRHRGFQRRSLRMSEHGGDRS
jgi:hypothetical protein